jgi:predicted nucleic acid-binding protein
MHVDVFFDTTVLIYAVTENDPRAAIAEDLLSRGGTLSVQVLNEFVAVARRKLNMEWDEIEKALAAIRTLCRTPVPIAVKTHEAAVTIARRYGFQIYDSLIVAAALDAGCTTLYSEDLQNGQTIDLLTVRNPFSE